MTQPATAKHSRGRVVARRLHCAQRKGGTHVRPSARFVITRAKTVATGPDCTGVRALVFAVDNLTPIPDAAVLYTCNVAVSASATGFIPLWVSGVVLADPHGNAVPNAAGINGGIGVENEPGDAATPAATSTDSASRAQPTDTPALPRTPTAVSTSRPGTMATATASPTATAVLLGARAADQAASAQDSGGCRIDTSGSGAGWVWLLPALPGVIRRRRSARACQHSRLQPRVTVDEIVIGVRNAR